jgi:hypothetical protein
MAKKITDLDDIGTPHPNDVLEIVDVSAGVSKRVKVSEIGGSETPTLQEVLDNNHDLLNGVFNVGTTAGFLNDGINQNSLGTGAGSVNTGDNQNALGDQAGKGNTGDNQNALGFYAGLGNIGSNVNVLGLEAGFNNEGDNLNALGLNSGLNNTGRNVNALGLESGLDNTFNNVNLFGQNAQADEDGQTVFVKEDGIMARLSTADLTETRKYGLQDSDGTIAHLNDIPTGELANLDEVGTNEIVNHAVTNNKLANMNANTVKGRLSGNGTPQDIAMANLPISTATQNALNLKQNNLGYTPSQTWYSALDGTSVANTLTITPTYTQLIPANTFAEGDVVDIFFRWACLSAKSTVTSSIMYINTTNNLSTGSPIQVGIANSGTTGRIFQMSRNLAVKAATTRVVSSTTALPSDIGSVVGLSSLNINWNVDQFIIFAISHSTADQPATFGDFYRITKN